MKKILLLALSIVVFNFAGAQDRSDSEIKRDFESEYKTLMKNLRDADSTTIGQLTQRAQAFESSYQKHRDLLNKSVYPDGYDGTIEKLQDQLKESAELVESKGRIALLEAKIKELSSQVDTLTQENAALLAQLKELKELKSQVESLRKIVKQLQDNIAKRDAAVFALVDSLFVQYDSQKLSSGDMKRLSSLEKNNVVANIKRSINDNMAFLSATGVSGLDFPQLLDEQRKFESSWSGIGKKLADAYVASKDRQREIAEVDGMIANWRSHVDEAFWKALNNIFADEKLAISPFTSGEELYNNVIRFIDDETNNTGNKSGDERVAAYEAFAYKTWGSKVKPVWVPVMKRNNMLTDNQVSDIDAKTQLWYARVQPGNTLLYVLVAALVLAILVGLYMGMKKRPTTTE